ncbi:ribosome recycling factor [Desulfurispirillum indicum]|uniref:Ribosome-recycling factor n=1 Tax=Desulfurispirillum indicum (strain ATCC BAA-1389 / DSM 22839 / S5) TaxID=653733 RepID=E6W170_DESIS|nr:ribosome recycling factor [Desulfurispirillum indicum]ADU66490.1 ribosome recycling factor [Desulfurispirillum indicum S5]UCZ55826.1 ribosome recycling factor [Desulfurispirillum indicum]
MVNDVYSEVKEKMQKAVEATRKDFSTLRTGRASTALLDNVKVDYYGTPTPLKQAGSVTIPDATTISIQPWEPHMLPAIEKAIVAANLGVTPSNDGQMIRISIPPLTEDRRKELTRQVKKFAEDGRIAVRNIRRFGNDSVKALEKDKLITEDEAKRAQEEVQKITDGFVKTIDEMAEAKEKELMTV